MSYGGFYETGTVSVAEDSDTVTGAGVLWSDIEEGDDFCCNGLCVPIGSINDDLDELTLKYPWPGATAGGLAYVIKKSSWLRYDPALTQIKLRDFLARLDTEGLPFIIEGAAPSDEDGEDDQWAIKTNTHPFKVWRKTGGAWVLQGTINTREQLAANRTYYVRTDGNNGNSGLANTSGGAFLTLQKAYDTVAGLDLNGYTVTIMVADGTYTAGLLISSPWTGGGAVVIEGNVATPANVLLNCAASACLSVTATLQGTLLIRGFKLVSTGGASTGLNHAGVGVMNFSNIEFGACSSWHIAAAASGARIVAVGSYKISNAAAAHILSLNYGIVQITGATVTLTGTPAWGVACVYATRAGMVIAEVVTFSGSATGARYAIDSNSVVYTGGGGSNYFPGNSAGSGGATPGGGVYA